MDTDHVQFWKCFPSPVLFLGLILMGAGGATHGAFVAYTGKAVFLANAGTTTMESFETVSIENWIYHTRLPSPISALDLDDDPGDDDDGPDFDLDGHFTITGNSLFGPVEEKFIIYDGAPTTDEVDGVQFLSFSPYYEALWPKTFDVDNQHPIITINNFDNSGAAINAFGLYLYAYDPGTPWVVMEYGDAYVSFSLSGGVGNYFIGVVTGAPFTQVQLHTNQNGGGINIDEIYYSADAPPIPLPHTFWLFAVGLFGVIAVARRSRDTA